jgi:hypothetical protein
MKRAIRSAGMGVDHRPVGDRLIDTATAENMANNESPALSRSPFGLSLPLIIGLLTYVWLLSKPARMLVDPDTYWHIAVGRWIIAHGTVPRHGIFSGTMAEMPWVAHEWLAEILFGGIYDHFGWAGVVGATSLSVATALALLLRALLRDLEPTHALIATLLAISLALTHLLARPHILILPILVLWTSGLLAARDAERIPSLRLVLLMTLWANLHGSYMLGLGLAALLGGEAILAAPDRRVRLHALRGWALFGALASGAALVTPFGIDGVLLPVKLINLGSLAELKEWSSPDFQYFQPLEVWILCVLFGAFSLGWRLPPIRVGIVLLLLHMALQHLRYGELLGLMAPLLLAPPLQLQLAPLAARRSAVPSIDHAMAAMAKPATVPGIALAGALLLVVSDVMLPGRIARESDAITPAAALAAVKAHRVEGPVFNDYGFGGYLIFSGIKPFIDGRTELYGDAFIKRCFDAASMRSDRLPQLLTEYGITWTLLPPTTPAVLLLDRLPGWRRLYADGIAVVHIHED